MATQVAVSDALVTSVERAQACGGTLRTGPAAGRGFTVEAALPCCA